MAERRRPMQAQDKLAFLLALVPYLMDRDRVTVVEAAAHFGVEPEQLREAVRLIAVSGVPGETNAYQPGDLFDIAWDDFEDNDRIVLTHQVAIDDSPRFSAREAAALIAGLQYLTSLPENADRDVIGSLMAKLARGASAAPSQVAVARSETDEALAVIRDAVIAGTRLDFDYRNSRGERERRRVDPLRVESIDQDWYLRGWDHARTALRTFRLDRIEGLTATDVPITYRPGDVTLPETLFEGTPDDQLVRIEVSASAVPLIEDYIPEGAERIERDGVVTTSVRVAHFHGLKRLVGGLSGVLTVLDPPEARRVVAEWAAAGAARYR
ncbi:WYL domain-containing protein [Leifsonia sp. ZF2019]|uniref:helix-turn-helix transcriptional regulator n=1 Tax=Leifsonia sp. ZF2019 TaxID=2781978 RepID=UPI001CBC8F68|nr:WYL domain-containing protein [Leifsonia sp. ZF2019]UAJ77837.1 WYL domain-containing protein [Leifsonia sp. ZF2019]